MFFIRDILEKNKNQLSKDGQKLIGQLYQRVAFGNPIEDNKTIAKVKKFSTDEIDDFLLQCLEEYDQTQRTEVADFDIHGLHILWSVLAFSKNEKVLAYFNQLIKQYTTGKPWFLGILHQIFTLDEIKHPLTNEIEVYYKKNHHNIPVYQLFNKLKIQPITPYNNWYITFVLTTDGEWIPAHNISKEEQKKRFVLTITLYPPKILNNTFEIEITNVTPTQHRQWKFTEYDTSVMFFDKNELPKPNILNLSQWIDGVEKHFGINFIFDKIAYMYIPNKSGINKKIITQWIKNRFKF